MKKNIKTTSVTLDYNLAQLLKQPTGATREYVLNEDLHGLDAALDVVAPLTGVAKVTRTRDGVLLTLSGQTRLRVACSRCLEPVETPIELHIEEQFLQTVDVITGVALEASRDDPALLIDSRHDLHLADVIREYLLLALPMHPLCREDCKGLCLHCGQNLNDGPCACPSDVGDARWATLQALLPKS